MSPDEIPQTDIRPRRRLAIINRSGRRLVLRRQPVDVVVRGSEREPEGHPAAKAVAGICA